MVDDKRKKPLDALEDIFMTEHVGPHDTTRRAKMVPCEGIVMPDGKRIEKEHIYNVMQWPKWEDKKCPPHYVQYETYRKLGWVTQEGI